MSGDALCHRSSVPEKIHQHGIEIPECVLRLCDYLTKVA